MIHYHGGPITPKSVARVVWNCRHAMISYAYPEQLKDAAEVCQSFALDNGAFTAWKRGTPVNWERYIEWLRVWDMHPAFDWALIPDIIDGSERQNDQLITDFMGAYAFQGGSRSSLVPVWHLHESIERLARLIDGWPRVALGSSGQYSDPGSRSWWNRMAEAMEVACDADGRPKRKLHLLRGLDPTLLSYLPMSSADSTNVAMNHCLDSKWSGTYEPATQEMRAMVLVDRIENHARAVRWNRQGIQQELTKNLELVG